MRISDVKMTEWENLCSEIHGLLLGLEVGGYAGNEMAR